MGYKNSTFAMLCRFNQGWTVGANPPGSSADWGDIISRIDKGGKCEKKLGLLVTSYHFVRSALHM